jgi:hypothetical protein
MRMIKTETKINYRNKTNKIQTRKARPNDKRMGDAKTSEEI